MKHRVLVDTGPLVAILSSVDQHHVACVDALRGLPGPLLTCWPVITEAAWLLRSWTPAVRRLLRNCSESEDAFLQLLPLTTADANPIAAVMDRYADLAPQLADAALVHLAERERIHTIFTLDRRDFSVYRDKRKRPFGIVP